MPRTLWERALDRTGTSSINELCQRLGFHQPSAVAIQKGRRKLPLQWELKLRRAAGDDPADIVNDLAERDAA
jgi:hypothetical protein